MRANRTTAGFCSVLGDFISENHQFVYVNMPKLFFLKIMKFLSRDKRFSRPQVALSDFLPLWQEVVKISWEPPWVFPKYFGLFMLWAGYRLQTFPSCWINQNLLGYGQVMNECGGGSSVWVEGVNEARSPHAQLVMSWPFSILVSRSCHEHGTKYKLTS